MPGRTHEHTFNAALGEALKKIKVHWQNKQDVIQVERKGLLAGKDINKRIDILINDGSSKPVAIETAFDKSGADKDAQARLEGEIETQEGHKILTAISVMIPSEYQAMEFEEIKETLFNGGRLFYALHQCLPNRKDIRRWPRSDFLEGDISDLLRLSSAVAMPQEWTEIVAEEVAESIKQATSRLSSLSAARQKALSSLIGQRTVLQSLQTTALLWLNACFVQYQLGKQGATDISPLPLENEVVPKELVEGWRRIIDRNWRSIFKPAVDALETASRFDEQVSKDAIVFLIKAVRKMDSEHLGLHINVGAELFPKLSQDRKTAAAFYTRAATAELLARLTIREKDLSISDWASRDLFEQHFVADLACGTGTLLRSAYQRITQLHEQHAKENADIGQTHCKGMESGLIGVDISPIAAHLATSSLAVIGCGEPYGETRIGWVDVGGSSGKTGAVEYLGTNVIYDMFSNVEAGRLSGVKERTSAKEHSISVENIKIDWILMNPPYSRTRGGQSVFDLKGLTEEERKKCQKQWSRLTRPTALDIGEHVNRKAGMAATFLLLAKRKVKLGGRIGFVLPLTAAFADSWGSTRNMLRLHFEDITVIAVVPGKPSDINSLSSDTNIEEMLLVATRRKGPFTGKLEPVRCVTLYSAFSRVGEATEIARAVEKSLDELKNIRPIIVGKEQVGQATLFHGEPNAPWHLLGVAHTELALAADALCKGELDHLIDKPLSFNVGMGILEDLFDIGPTHDLIGHLQGGDTRGAFEFREIINEADAIGGDLALWGANSKTQKQLIVSPTHKGMSHKNAPDIKREEMREKRSTLFYARNMRWTSQALLVATTARSVHGGRTWAALRHKDANVHKVFALWANSTLGMVVHWTQGQRTQTGRSTTQIGALRNIPCPRFDHLPNNILKKAAKDFDKLADKELLPACQAHTDDIRNAIDESVIRLLQLKPQAKDFISDLRNLWCREPSVHGNNREALKALSSSSLPN